MSTSNEVSAPHRGWHRVVLWAGVPLLLAALNEYALHVALPSILGEFDLDLSGARWTLIAFLVADAAVLIIAGRYGDRVGRQRTSVFGLVLIVAGSVICLIAPTYAVLILGRVIEGFGMGVVFSGLLAIVADAAPRESIGRAFGLWAFIGAVAVFVSPVIGGVLAEHVSWRWIFGVNAVIAVGALLTVRRLHLVKPTPGLTRAFQHAELVKIRSYVSGTCVMALIYFTVAMTWMSLVFNAAKVLGFGATVTGALFLLYAVWWLVLPPFTGRLADRIGARRPMLWGAAASAIGSLVLVSAANAQSVALLAVGLGILGVGVALAIPATNAATMGPVPAEMRGDASGVNMTARLAGSIAGLLVGSTLLAGASRDDVLAGAPWIGVAGALAMVLAVIVTAVGVRPTVR